MYNVFVLRTRVLREKQNQGFFLRVQVLYTISSAHMYLCAQENRRETATTSQSLPACFEVPHPYSTVLGAAEQRQLLWVGMELHQVNDAL